MKLTPVLILDEIESSLPFWAGRWDLTKWLKYRKAIVWVS